MLPNFNERAQEIFRLIVDSYLASGEPVGSRALSKQMGEQLSSASIRNVMADLEEMGLLYAPHTSAGRMPTQTGLRLFVDALMEVSELHETDRTRIESLSTAHTNNLANMFEEAGKIVSGLSSCAAVVATPKLDRPVRQMQFVPLEAGRTIAIIVFMDGSVENRVINLPADIQHASLITASNYVNARLGGQPLSTARTSILSEIAQNRAQLDTLSATVVKAGLAIPDTIGGHLFVRGTSKLLEDPNALENIEAIQALMETLDRQETMAKLLEAAEEGQGVRIFIGSENKLFSHSGLSMVVAPARNARQQVVGAVGVIGPTRMSYGRVVPIIDYTAQVLARVIG